MRTLSWIVIITMVGASACGDDTSGSGGDGDSAGSTGASSSTGEDGSTSAADGSGDGSTTDGPQTSSSGGTTGGQGACEPDGDLLYPLAEGRAWTFQVQSSGCEDPMYAFSVGGTETVGGREAFVVTIGSPACGMADVHLSQSGQVVDQYDPFGDTWIPVVEEPIEDGSAWSDGDVQWEAVPTITVPAGTFTDCWRAANTDGITSTTFCPGVGPVEVLGQELTQRLVGCD